MPADNFSVSVSGPLVLVAVSAAFVLLGSLADWVQTPAGTFAGADGLGWLGACLATVAIAVAGSGFIARPSKWLMLVPAAVGVVGVAAAGALWLLLRWAGRGTGLLEVLIDGRKGRVVGSAASLSAAWGLYVLFWASLVLLISSLVVFVRRLPALAGRDSRPGHTPLSTPGDFGATEDLLL
jgi:hypothetical protein